MATSKREEALAALHAVLAAGLSGARIFRSPNFPLGYSDLPAVVLEDGAEEVADLRSGILDITTVCVVGAFIKASTQDRLGTDLNALAAQVRAAVGGDPTLGDRVIAVDYAGCSLPDFVLEDGAPPHASIDLTFRIRRQEAEHNPYAYL